MKWLFQAKVSTACSVRWRADRELDVHIMTEYHLQREKRIFKMKRPDDTKCSFPLVSRIQAVTGTFFWFLLNLHHDFSFLKMALISSIYGLTPVSLANSSLLTTSRHRSPTLNSSWTHDLNFQSAIPKIPPNQQIQNEIRFLYQFWHPPEKYPSCSSSLSTHLSSEAATAALELEAGSSPNLSNNVLRHFPHTTVL